MKVYELLDHEAKWTKGDFARDDAGNYVPVESARATCWCVLGGIMKCYKEDHIKPFAALRRYTVDKGFEPGNFDSFSGPISLWNDDKSTTYEEVVSVLKELDI